MNPLEYLVFYKNRDNSILVKLYQNGISFNYASISKAEIKWKTGSVDSQLNTSLFTIDTNGIRLKLGSINVPAQTDLQAKLIIYSSGWPNGVVWNGRLNIRILEG
jgi:hypothetical protein